MISDLFIIYYMDILHLDFIFLENLIMTPHINVSLME